MPLRGLKASATGTDSRRHSVLGAPSSQNELDNKSNNLDDAITSRKSATIGRRSPLNQEVDQDSPTTSTSALGEQQTDVRLRPTRSRPTPKSHRFSLMKFRHASDPNLSASYNAEEAPPVPNMPMPTIITTSPTVTAVDQSSKKKSKSKLFSRTRHKSEDNRSTTPSHLEAANTRTNTEDRSRAPDTVANKWKKKISFETPSRPLAASNTAAPPPYGDDSNTSLALPVSRLSESSRSDESSGDHGIYAQTTTTHTISTTTTFFKLPRRKKDKGPLFPLPVKIPPPDPSLRSPHTPKGSSSGAISASPGRKSPGEPPLTAIRKPDRPGEQDDGHPSPLPSPSHSMLALTNAPLGSPGPAVVRKDSSKSHHSTRSNSTMPPPPALLQRGRSATMGSLNRDRDGEHGSDQLVPSGRTSTSTTGRKSFGDMFSLSYRLRQNSEPPNPRHGSPARGTPATPGSMGSKPNSFSLPREALVYPERKEGDTPASYLEKLEAAVNRGVIASILCKSADDFFQTCLRKYMRGFNYFGDAIDMAIRKMLMEVELPKETQQIDRLLQGFANRYCECNPGIFVSTDEAYFVAFSILLLHSDTHNKNNKRKMQKQDYVKNTQDQVEVSQDILECFYDNVSYTPFIHFEDEVAINSHRLAAPKSRKNLFKSPSSETLRGPIDPYTLILDNKLHFLRPSLKDVVNTEDTYSSTGSKSNLDIDHLFNAFLKAGVLQIVSARSRPDAFLNQATITNPAEAQVGLVDIKAAKVGLLWRKDLKKKKARSPWQEWGAILTSSQLYFFRDVHWLKSLISQQESHEKSALKAGSEVSPVLFKPPLTEFKPDALMSMDDAVALLDTSYRKHKHAFTFVKHGGFEEVFLANDETDMNDWVAKLNYAATFRTVGVRMRTQVGPVGEPQRRPFTRTESHTSTRTLNSKTGDVQFQTRQIDHDQAQEIMAYRRHILLEKIDEADQRLSIAQKEMDNLMRNARHLFILCPVQQKSREALVFAAGRMSAKLKWLRVEMGRTRCHRDVIRLDLDQECRALGIPLHREASTQKVASSESHSSTGRPDSRISAGLASPKGLRAETSRSGSQAPLDRLVSSEGPMSALSDAASTSYRRPSNVSIGQSAAVSVASADLKGDYIQSTQGSPPAHSLMHQASIVSSPRGDAVPTASRVATPEPTLSDDGEQRLLRDAGLIGPETTPPSAKPPDTSGSEKDQLPETTPDSPPIDRSKLRRSLQRTLRDQHHGPHLPHHHRSKKGKDSNSSAVMSEDNPRPASQDSESLARGTGSFTLHGKKASVITFGSEWQTMPPEDRLKLRKQSYADASKDAKDDATEGHSKDHTAEEDQNGSDTASVKSFSTATAGSLKDASEPSPENRAVADADDDTEPTTPTASPRTDCLESQAASESSPRAQGVKQSPLQQEIEA
ncbi:MAG: hypothetical protein Q9227_004280 [Pyrenula ochraceoflavens]